MVRCPRDCGPLPIPIPSQVDGGAG
jgi:hypothetical protein